MLKSNKRFINISILVFPLLFFVGCNANIEGNIPTINQENHKPMGKAIYAPVEIPYVIDNPIDIITINVSNANNNKQEYFQVSGLVDQDVEDSINKAIKELFDSMVPYTTGEKLAPYRGIQSSLQPNYKVESSTISVIPQFNSNNVLSVVAYVWGTYYNSTNDYVYFSVVESLNFDLNTGEEFLIEDLFTNDVDGLAIINYAIINEIERTRLFTNSDYYEYTSLPLAAPFKGISNNQKFFLTYDGINIVIDHNNPEFDVGFYYNTVLVPFYSADGNIAITERFYDENNSIFTNEANSKRFLRDNPNENRSSNNYNKSGIEWYVSTSSPNNLNEKIINIMDDIRVEQEELVFLLSQDTTISFVEQNIYTYRIGKFINISSLLMISGANDSVWQQNNYVYSESGEPIGLEDIFVEGYDYSTLINKAIDKAIKDYGYPERFDSEDIFENLMFTLNDTHISFITQPQKWYSNSTQLYFTITYEEVGFKNLKIFD